MSAPQNRPKNKLYYGDNLAVLRDYGPDSSIIEASERFAVANIAVGAA